MKCIILIEDESTNRGGWADVPPLDSIPEEIFAKFLMVAYKEALSNLQAHPVGGHHPGVIDVIRHG